MEFTFDNLINLISVNIFAGSTTLAGLTLMLVIWAVCAIICLAMKAPAVYTIVPLIPISIFFMAYGVLNETVSVIIIIVVSVVIAAEFKKVVD